MKRLIRPLIFFYLAGLGASLYLVSLTITRSSPFCELFGSDCAAVALSDYGSFMGFSTASFGLGYYVIQLALLFSSLASSRKTAGKVPNTLPALMLNLAACAASLFFAAILFLILRQNCMACIVVHTVNFLTLPLNFLAWKKERGAGYEIPVLVAVLLLGLTSTLFVQIADTRHALRTADARTRNFLELALAQYDAEQKFSFDRKSGDAIYGDPAAALYQVVLIYRGNCPHCRRAKAKLIDLVTDHPQALYLLTINHATLGRERLRQIKVERVPAVFIDGKRASGWEIEGFMESFIQNCEC